MKHKVDEKKINSIIDTDTLNLTDEELNELRSDLEMELYWLDREFRCMSTPDCIINSQTRTSRDVEIDRDFILDKIKFIDRELQ